MPRTNDHDQTGILKRVARKVFGSESAPADPPAPAVVITPQPTPNPNSTKFSVNRRLLDGPGRDFPEPDAAADSPLAFRLFHRPEVRGVFIGPGFVTVTASADADWFALADFVKEALEAHIASGEPAVAATGGPEQRSPADDATAIEQGIQRVLNTEIRPAVAMDGGDVTFDSFRDGVVYLRLRGACSGCPSSLMTLKMGIEERLKEDFPEIRSVQAV